MYILPIDRHAPDRSNYLTYTVKPTVHNTKIKPLFCPWDVSQRLNPPKYCDQDISWYLPTEYMTGKA